MSDILKQIQVLQEQFSNLFEVEGLGNPAVDVPPSQNKIKKDVKTKDGKAELVSVEDELFPYDGNKREQYRQKILNTINGMIQGTSTLEDLLQIVRQKKAPLKEAMEVLESIINEVSDEWKEKAQQKAYSNLRNAQIDKDNKETAFNLGDMGVDREQVKDAIRNVQKHAARAAKLDNAIMKHDVAKMEGKIKPASESLKEAVEILEGMINELYPDTVKSALHAHNKKTIELEDKVNKRIGEIFKKHGIKGNTYSAATAEDIQKAAETEKEIKEDPEIKDLHNQQEKRAKKNELYRNAIRKARKSPVEEALEIMEAIINEVSDKTAQSALDAAQQRYNRKGYEASMKLFRGDSKGAIEDGNKAQDEYNKHLGLQLKRAKRLGKKLVQDKNDHDSFKIEEALELMEAIINEVSMDKWKEAAASSLPKRKEEAEAAKAAAEKGWEEYDKVSREHPEDEPALYRLAQAKDEEAAKAEDKADHAYAVTRLIKDKADGNTSGLVHGKANANKAIKAAKKVQDKREDEFGRNPEKRTFLRSGKANQLAAADPVKSRADEALEEALAIISEVSKKFIAPRLEAGAEKAEQIAKRKEEIIADPKRTEKEKDEAAKENAAYQCKAINVTNDAVKYEEKKQKKK